MMLKSSLMADSKRALCDVEDGLVRDTKMHDEARVV